MCKITKKEPKVPKPDYFVFPTSFLQPLFFPPPELHQDDFCEIQLEMQGSQGQFENNVLVHTQHF